MPDHDALAEFERLVSKQRQRPESELDEFERLIAPKPRREARRPSPSYASAKIGEPPLPPRPKPKNDRPGDIDLRDSVRHPENRSASSKQNPPPKQKPSRLRQSLIDVATSPEFEDASSIPRGEPGEFGKATIRGTGSMVEMLGGAAQTATGGAIGETGRKIGRSMRESVPQARVARRQDVHGVGDAADYVKAKVGEGIVTTAPIMAAGALTGGLGAGAVAFALAAGETRMELESLGITDEATIRKVTAVVAPAVGLLDTAVPLTVVKNIIRSSVRRQVVALGLKGTTKLVTKTLAKTSLAEGATEGTQSIITHAGTRAMTGRPIDTGKMLDGAVEEVIGGALVGGGMGTVESASTVENQARHNRSYDYDAAALGLGVHSRPATPKRTTPDAVRAQLHVATPPEFADRIAQSANEKAAEVERAAREPERITGAAIMVKGNTYTGAIHADAVRTAIEAGDLPAELLNGGEMDATHLDHGAVDGFVTSKGGRFVTRAEAEEIAERAEQIREDRGDSGVPGELDATDLKAEAVEPPKVGEMRTMDIFADPPRFQFKSGKDEKSGAGGALKKVDLYREDLAGIMTVWRDPADSKVYVVNGHHRLDLAKRSGAPTVLVRFITAPTAEAARAQGAIQNIAENQGTPTDVAKFLRDSGQTLEDLKAQGVPVEAALAAKGIGLSRLAPDLFQKVATGKIEESVGVGIGSITGDPDMQRTAAAVIGKSGKRLTEKEAADVARQIVAEGSENVSQETLFGTEQETVPLYVEKAQLAGAIQRRLENDKRLFSYVTKGSRADELARAGNVIDKERSAEIAAQSGQLGEVFRQLFTRKGAVSDALTEGARRLAHGEKGADVVESIYDGIRQEIQAAFSGGKGENVPGDEGDVGGHEEEGGAPDEVDPTQDALFDPGLPWEEIVRRQRARLYEKLNRAEGKDARNAVIRELRELDKLKSKDPTKAVSQDEMASRARAGETKEAVEAIAGEDVVPTSTDRAQSDIFAEEAETVSFTRKDGTAVSFRVKKNANQRGDTGLVPLEGTMEPGDPEVFDQARARYGRTVFIDHRPQNTEPADRDELEESEQGSFLSPETLDEASDEASIDDKPLDESVTESDTSVVEEDLDARELEGYDTPVSIPAAAVAIRAKAGLPPAPRPPRALIEISRDLADAAGVPLRQGRFNAAVRKAAGVFFPHSETTRVRRYDQVATVAHEVGHFASKRHLKNPASKGAVARGAMALSPGMLKELRQMGKNLYGGRKPAAGYGEEGIAEAFKFYVTDPARLTTEAPEFATALEVELAKVPAVHKALLQARADFAAHTASDATGRADAMLSVNENTRNMPTVKELVRQAVDDLHPFREAVESIGGTDDITKHAYVLARLTRGDAGLAEEMNERGVIDFHTRKRITSGIIPVLRSIPKKHLQEFRRYLFAERALELWKRNIDVGMTLADAKEIQQLYEKDFRTQAEAVWAHSNALLKYRRDAGLLTDSEYNVILSRNKQRVPMYVVFDEKKDNTSGGGWGKKWSRNSSGLNAIKGSARVKIDPLEGMLQDTYRTVEQANRHHVAATLFKLGLETEGGGKAIEEVARPKEKVQVNTERVLAQLVDLGIVDPTKIVVSSAGGIAIEKDDGSIVEIDGTVLEQWDFREQQNARDQKDMIVPVIIGGVRKWLQIQDPKLFDALNALGHDRLPGWARFLGIPARVLRAGATLTPEFLGRNPFRDIFTIAAYTRSTNPVDAVPGVIFAKGFFHFVQKDDVFQRWRLEGGDNAAQLAIDRKEIQNHIEHVTRNWKEIAGDLVIHPIDVLRMVSAAMENATRLGEFTVVEKSRLKEGKSPREASVAAALASRDGTIDFGRHGIAAKSINQIVAFFNANVQGTEKLIQEHRRRPGTVAMRAIAGITIPSLILYAMQHDDPDYQKLPRWRRSLFWNWVQRDENGELVRIWSFPKPFELGILYGTLPEAIAEWWLENDPAAFKEWARATWEGFTPPIIPTGLGPIVENWANKSFFTGRKIVPAGAERRLSKYQTREWTGEAARVIGEQINYSPAKIENLVRGWLGGLGSQYALPALNAAVRKTRELQGKEPMKRRNPVTEDTMARIPGVKGFIAYTASGNETRQVDEFYEAFELADGIRHSYKALRDGGRRKEASAFAAEHRKELAAMRTSDAPGGPGLLRSAHNRLEKVRQQRTDILRNDGISSAEKKRRVRILDDRMVRIAEEGLAALK